MSSLPGRPDLANSDTEEAPTIDAPDGRVMRRKRNMEAVRTAVLDLLKNGEQPTLAGIADRAGVATRSVYRYFGDVDTAVGDAVSARRARVLEVFESEPIISQTAPITDRLGMLVLRRLRLDRLTEPVDSTGVLDDLVDQLDAEVRAAFAPELESNDEQLALLLCGLFRLRGVRSMRDVFGDADQAIASAMIRAGLTLLTARSDSA